MLFTRRQVANDEPRQARLPLEADEVVRVDREIEDQSACNVRDEVSPAAAIRGVHGGRDDLEILGAVRVGENEKALAAGNRAVVDAVFLPRLPAGDETRCIVRPVRIDDMRFGRLVVMGFDDDVTARLGLADADEEPGIVVAVYRDVGLRVGSDDMAEDLGRPVIAVHPNVEERPAVVGPYCASRGLLDDVRKIDARFRIADAQREILVAPLVGRIGDEPVIMTVREAAEPEIRLSRRESVGIEQHLLIAAVAPRAHHGRVLGAVGIAGGVSKLAVGSRHGGIVFLDAPAHFRDQRQAKCLDVGHGGGRVGVLRIEIGSNFRIERRGIAHDRLPVDGAEPAVVVGSRQAVMGRRYRAPHGHRRPDRGASAGAMCARFTLPGGWGHGWAFLAAQDQSVGLEHPIWCRATISGDRLRALRAKADPPKAAAAA